LIHAHKWAPIAVRAVTVHLEPAQLSQSADMSGKRGRERSGAREARSISVSLLRVARYFLLLLNARETLTKV